MVFGKIERGTERIAADGLDAGAVAQGRLTLDLAPVDLRQLLGTVATDMEATGIVVEDGAEVTVRADTDRVARAVASLFGHALRLADGARIDVRILTGNLGTVEVVTAVASRDITFEQVMSLFEPYDREDTSIGTGLGLFLCRALIVAHGGEIGVRSEESGTAFWFRIPSGGPDAGPSVERTSS